MCERRDQRGAESHKNINGWGPQTDRNGTKMMRGDAKREKMGKGREKGHKINKTSYTCWHRFGAISINNR